MRFKNIIILTSILALTSCAFQSKDKWVKNNSTERDYIIADSSCTAESYKAAPAVSLSGSNDDMSQAVLFGKMKEVRNKVYDGCMMEKEWKKQPLQ